MPGHTQYYPPASATQILKSLNVVLCSEVEGGLSSEQANKRLRLFVPAAAELSRQREANQLGPKHQLSMVRAALRLGRQVSAPCPLPLPLALPGTSALCCCLMLAQHQTPVQVFKSKLSTLKLKVKSQTSPWCYDSNLIVRQGLMLLLMTSSRLLAATGLMVASLSSKQACTCFAWTSLMGCLCSLLPACFCPTMCLLS